MSEHAGVVNALSFDVEEWYQAEVFADIFPHAQWEDLESRCERETDFILGVLRERGVTATFFMLGWLAERHPSLVGRIVGAGHELACHGYHHTMITRQTRQEFSADVRRAKGILEDLGGREVVGYRAPTFSITKGTEWALEVLFENDLLYDASVYPIRHDRYGIPAAPRFPYAAIERGGRRLWEFPGPTLRLAGITLPAAGGGYLRLFPYRWARAAIRATNRTGRTMTVFAHPWEFDAGLPDVKLPWVAHVRHYGGIRGNGKKLRRLLSEFRFAPLIDVLRRLERKSRAGEGG